MGKDLGDRGATHELHTKSIPVSPVLKAKVLVKELITRSHQ